MPSTLTRSRAARGRRIVTNALAASAGTALLVSAAPVASAETYPRPLSGVFTLDGRGFGHGHGLSQWGAYGMARHSHSYAGILAFYYPGTRLVRGPAGRTIRVWVSIDDERDVRVVPARGLTLTWGRRTQVLPTAYRRAAVTQYRAYRSVAGTRVDLFAGRRWYPVRVAGRRDVAGPLVVTPASALVRLVLPGGTQRGYRGRLVAAPVGARSLYAVASMPLDTYLRGVVPNEMPPSWTAAALQAQAVAARTYALWSAAGRSARAYDICDSTACQYFPGSVGYSSTGAVRKVYEDTRATAAISATGGRLLTYRGVPAFSQFSAANGGYSAPGSAPYLAARPDPYDGAVPNPAHAWRRAVSATRVQAAFPAVGSLRTIRVTRRDGRGVFGGRILSLALDGSRGTVAVSGSRFRRALGLRSEWWRVVS